MAAFCDMDARKFEAYRATIFTGENQPDFYSDYEQLLARKDIEAVIIATCDFQHQEVALAAIRAGKHILLEKPMESSKERATAIFEAAKDYDKTFMMGFVLRFALVFSRAKEIIDAGTLGTIVSIQAVEKLAIDHAASYARRWHRFNKNSGGIMNTKCCHDMDILRYFVGSDARQVAAFGGNRIFVENKEYALHCCDCKAKDSCIYAFDYTNYDSIQNLSCAKDFCVYNSEYEICDHEVMIIHYENGVVGQFELCLFSAEPNRKMSIHGTKATLKLDFLRNTIRVAALGGEAVLYELKATSSGHGGGDSLLIEHFLHSCSSTPINQAWDGYVSSLTAFVGDRSMETRSVVEVK